METDDFDELMRSQGVRPLDGRREDAARPRREEPAPAPPAREPAPVPPAPAPASDAELVRAREALAAARRESDELRRQLDERGREVAKLRDEIGKAHAALDPERQRADSLARELAELRQAAGGAPVARALAERGVREREHATALVELLIARPADTLRALSLADAGPLATLLANHLLLLGPGVAPPAGEHAVLRVEAERCELTEGTALGAAYASFAEACRAAGVKVVTIVGGSVAYRKQLGELEGKEGREPRLNLVSGTARRNERHAQADIRASDLVIVWGGTELDHSVSLLYRGDKVAAINNRGLSGMLERATQQLRTRRG